MTDDEDGRSLIIVEEDGFRHGFTMVPNIILKAADLTHGAKLCYAMLLSYAWQGDKCFPGQETLGNDLGVERKAVIRYLKELKDKGLVRVTRRGMGKTNVYVIARLSDVPFLGHLDVPSVVPLDVLESGHKEYPVKEDPKKKTQNSNFEDSKAPTPLKRAQPVIPEFKASHPDLWQAGCSGVAEFIRVVGRGLWSDEEMNVAQWRKNAKSGSTSRTEG